MIVKVWLVIAEAMDQNIVALQAADGVFNQDSDGTQSLILRYTFFPNDKNLFVANSHIIVPGTLYGRCDLIILLLSCDNN